MAKFLSEAGLTTVWGRIDSLFLRKAGGDVTGTLNLYSASGDSPALVFRRGTLTDTLDDWRVFNTAGNLKFQRTSGSTTNWQDYVVFTPTAGTVTINGNTVLHSGNYNSSTYADTVPTQNSTKLITSGGMYSVIEEIEDVVAASENSLNDRLTTLEGSVVTGSGLTADKIVLGNGGRTVKTSSKGIATSVSSSSDDTTVPTSKAVWDAFGSVASALKYKGTVASNSALPATHAVGDVWVVSTAGTFVGKACEVGDYIVCKTAGTSANDAHWDVLNGENQVENKSASLAAAGSSATIATVDGTNITVTTPSGWTGLAKTGTVTSVGMTVPTGLSVSGSPITTSGTLALSFTSGYSIPTTAKQTNWDTAYGWGNHSGLYLPLSGGTVTGTLNVKRTTSEALGIDTNLKIGTAKRNINIDFGAGSGTGINDGNSGGLVFCSGNSAYGGIYAQTSGAYGLKLHFATTNSFANGAYTRMLIDHSGNVGIGTLSPSQKLHVAGTIYSSVATGTAPFKVDSTTAVTNLNADLLDGKHASDFATSGHTHTTSLATSTGTSALSLAYGTKYSLTAGGTSYIFTTPSLGTTATTAAAGNHTHTLSIAADSGTNALTLAAGTKYKLTAGGSTFIFTMPSHQSLSGYLNSSNYNSSTYADTTPTQNSTKLITSGGVWTALDDIETTVAASEDALNTRVTTLENNYVSGSGLTSDTIILGNSGRAVKTSSKTITTTAPSSSSDDTTIPTSKAVNSSIGSAISSLSSSYLKLDGSNVMNGNIKFNMANTDKFIVYSYDTNGSASSNSWRTGVLGTGSGEANYYVVQYQTVNTTGTAASTWHNAIQIGQSTGTVTFSVNPKIGTSDNIHAGNYTSYVNTTNFPGLNKTGTVTSITLTAGTGISLSATGAITTSGSRTISLASGVATAGTYRSVTVDTYGRVTSGTNPTTLSGYGITDAKIASGTITLGSNTITPLTSSSTLDATKLSGTIPTSCLPSDIGGTDIRFADYFGESTTAASTVAKVTTNNSKTLASGDLVTGLSAIIYHQYANSGANATLNVGGSGAKAMYNAAGTRISGSTGTWTAKDIIRWVYDTSLNSGSGGWKISAILGNGSSHRLRLLTGLTPLYTESYTGTVTSVATGAGLTGGTITSSGTIKANLNSETSLGTIGTTSKLYAVGVDSTGKLCVNVPWEAGTTTVSNKAATIGTSLTTIATIAGTNITAKIGSYASSSHSHAFSAITSKPTTVSGYGITDAVTGVQLRIRSGGNYDVLSDAAGNAITYTPTSGTVQIGAIPQYREDAEWGDYVWRWENSEGTGKVGCIYKNGEQVLYGNTHIANTLAFWQSGTHQLDTEAHYLNTGTIGAAFYANNNGGGDANSSAFFIQVCTAAGGWNTHEYFKFTKDGIYAYPASGRTGITGWFINESDALTISEIDSILANAT